MIFINKRPSYIVIAKFPIEKVISSKVVNNTPITKEIYSNYNLENPIVKRYNQKIYLDGDLTLTGNTTSGCYKDSYFFSDNISHSGLFLNITATYDFNDFGGARKIKEFPNPVTLRTDNGKVVRFYQNNDFTNPVYEVACLRAIREKRGSDEEKTWYWDNWSRITRVYNLIPGETYLYKVFDTNNLLITGIYKENTSYGEFTTKGLIRTLRIIGTVNARDSGGYKTVDGTKRVRYGKLFRGSQLSPGYYNNNTLGTYNKVAKRRWIDGVDNDSDKFIGGIDNVSIQEIINLGITKDIDLRDPASLTANLDDYGPDGSSSDFRHFIVSNTDGTTVNRLSISDNITVNGQVLNDGISYASIAKINSTKNNLTYAGTNLQSYDGMFVTNNTETLDNGKRQFVTFIEEVISGLEHRDANNNPRNDGAIYVHCQQGRDRTGTFMACLFALLDVNDDGIIKDYELTTTTDSIATRWHLQGSKGSTTTFPVGSNVREYIYNWATTNSPTGQYVTATQINTLKELLLEDIPEELEEAPIRYKTYLIENPTIKSYLTASKRSGDNAYTMNDLLMQAHTPSDSEGDWSSYKPVNMTKGVSLTDLKNIECPPGSGLKFMKDNHTVQNYKYGLLLATDVKTEAKPNYYSLNDPNIDSITITDSVTSDTYTIKNYGDTTPYVLTDFGGVTDRFTFDSLPLIGTSTYSHVLDKVKPGLRKLGTGCKLALLPGDALSKINNKYTKFNTSCTFTNISLVNYYDETEILKSNITPLRTLEYTSDFDWSAFDDLAGTLAAPNRYYILIFKSNNSYYAGVEIKCGPLHQSTPTKIWNLIPGRGYHYEAKDANNNIIASGNIKPEGLLRMLFFEGVYNVRDLGGWPCYDANGNYVGRIAYDRLYRGSRPETDTTYWHRSGATMNDRRMMTNFIKLGKLLDLRESDTDGGRYTYLITSGNTLTTSASAFGLDFTNNKIPRVRVSQISYWAAFDYTSISDGISKVNPIRQVFLAIGEIVDSLKNNKSTYFNCALGADRTGTLAMVVEALVGANDDALLKDWELTSFSGCLMENTKGSYLGSMSDYRALHTDCSEKASSNSGSHDLVKLILTSNYLQELYNQNSLSKNIVEWFKEVSTFNNLDALTDNTVRYMHNLGLKEVYNHSKPTNDSGYVAVNKTAGTIASSVSASYLGAINTIAGTAFTNAELVMDYLKWKLIDWRSSVKTMAVLGDSLSAYDTDDRCPLLKLWWYQFAQSIGLDPNTDVNNNSEGNTKVARSKKNATDMGCSQTRIDKLKVNGKDPDLIFVMMGGNDWAQHVPLGRYTYGDYIQDPISTLLDFKPAFALMLTRIKDTYPYATVVCVNEPLLLYESIGDNNEFVFEEYMQAQVDIAKMFNCQVVDLYHLCGNLIHNNMSTYTSDLMVHLNATGHTLIANIIK